MFSCLVPSCIPVSVNSSGYEPRVTVSDLVSAAEVSDRDRWGFEYNEEMAARLNDYEKNFFAAKRARREARFENALKRYGSVGKIPADDMKEFGRKGFPDEHRVEIWCEELEVASVRGEHDEDFYEELLKKELPSKIGRVIEVDLRRTFPHHPDFQEDAVVERLRNVLWAFAAFHPDIGYCQGMNFIAATMMMVVFRGAVTDDDSDREKEKTTFWLFSQFITSDRGLHNSGYYQPGMAALLTDIYAFDRLSSKKASDAHQHLEECGVQDMSWICVEWFQTAYSTVFAFDTVLRIWDPIMTEGWKVLFRVGVAIFKIFQNELDAMDFEEIMQDHKKLTSNFVDHNRLMKVAFYGLGVVKRSQIASYRQSAPRHNPSRPMRQTCSKLMTLNECSFAKDSREVEKEATPVHNEIVATGDDENQIAVYEDARARRDAEWHEYAERKNKLDHKQSRNLYDSEGAFLDRVADDESEEPEYANLRSIVSAPNLASLDRDGFDLPPRPPEEEPRVYESRGSLRNRRSLRQTHGLNGHSNSAAAIPYSSEPALDDEKALSSITES